MDIFLLICSSVFVLSTFITLLPFDHWLVRIFDFPKVQLLILSVVVFSLDAWLLDYSEIIVQLLGSALLLAIGFHVYRIVPYTWLFPKEVVLCQEEKSEGSFSVIASNVLMNNDHYSLLLDLVSEYKPDLLLTLESNEIWERELSTLESEYNHVVRVPQDNLYGMHLYSKLPLKEVEVRNIVKDEIPSIRALVQLPNKEWVRVYCLHPKPPSPKEAPDSVNRDAELLKVGKEVQETDEPTIVFGDLNDVAWSRSTTLFRKTSGLLDPRIGRGLFCTFHADYKLFRWPLDHLFHSVDFCLLKLKVLPNIGSDHFPIYAKLQFSQQAEQLHEEPEADSKEEKLADEKIAKAR